MGTNAVISVLGFIIVFTLVAGTLNTRNRQSYDNTYGYVKHTTARDIARNSIQITLRKIDTIATVASSCFPVSGSIDGGSFNVDGVILNDTTLRLTARGTFSDSLYMIKTTIRRNQIELAPGIFNEALGLRSSPVNLALGGSKDTIDGRNHDWLGNLIPASPDSVPAVRVMTPTDSMNAWNANISHLGEIIGTPKIAADTSIPDPNKFADSFYQIADSLYVNKGSATVNLPPLIGDSTHPVVVFCDGTNAGSGKTSGKFKFHGEGWGILVVKGNLSITSAGAVWHGLIIEYGNTPLTFDASSGNCQVYGGVLFGGAANSTYTLGGNSKILYSKDALYRAENIRNYFLYSIIDWYEY